MPRSGTLAATSLRPYVRVCRLQPAKERDIHMLRWAVIFLVVALIAAAMGFGGIAGDAAGIAKILFVVFLVIAAISLVLGRRTV